MLTSKNHPPIRLSITAVLAAVLGGGLAGLLAGVDAILLIFLLIMLGGSEGGDLAVAGLGHAGWSAADGVVFGLGPVGVVILVVAVASGVMIALARRRRRHASRHERSAAGGRARDSESDRRTNWPSVPERPVARAGRRTL